MAHRLEIATQAGTAKMLFTDRSDGDFHVDTDPERREATARALIDRPWSWVRQVHGCDVIDITEPGGGSGACADSLITTVADTVLSVRGADCPIVAFTGDTGVIGVAHAGWRGLLAGVLERTVEAMRAKGAAHVAAYLGPCITAPYYEFGPADLDLVAGRFGDEVRARTGAGTPALDLVAAVRSALASVEVSADLSAHRCTAADPLLYSHRTRGDTGRHTAAIWLEQPPR